MKQKIIARLLSVCMIFSLIPAAAFAVDAEKTIIDKVTATVDTNVKLGSALPTSATVNVDDAYKTKLDTSVISWVNEANETVKTAEAAGNYTGTFTVKINDDQYAFAADTGTYTLTGGEFKVTETTLTGTVTLKVAAADPTKYAITVTPSDNGTVTAEPAEAAEGETVTLTVTPDDGFILDTLTVTGPNDAAVKVTDDKFVMPAGPVTVTATFKAVTVEVGDTVVDGLGSIAEDHKEAVETALKSVSLPKDLSSAVLPDGLELPEGNNVTITVALKVEAKSYEAGKTLSMDITPTYTATAGGTTKSGTISSFKEPVTITIELPEGFVPVAVLHEISAANVERIKVTVADGTASFNAQNFSVYTLTAEDAEFSINYRSATDTNIETKTYKFSNVPNDSLRANTNGWTTKLGDEKVYNGNATLDEVLFNELYALSEDTNYNLVLYAVSGSSQGGNGGGSGSGGGASSGSNHAISVGSPANGKISVTPANAGRGTSVTINLTPDAGYVVGTVTVTDANGNRINVTRVNDTRYTFTMPAGRVTVNATFVRADANMPFTDVANGEYYYDAVLWAVAKGITTGTSETRFSPNVACTRAQIVTFLWRAAGSPVVTGSNPFTDVASNEYYYNAVLWAVRQGITTGTSASSFSPNATCNRAQTVTFLYRYAGSPAVSGSSSFGDVAANEYYTSAVNWAVAQGVTNGTSTNAFSPANDCTRGHVVTFLYRYMGD